LVAFESQTLHVVAEVDLVSVSLSEFFSKLSIFDFEGIRGREGHVIANATRCSSMIHGVGRMNMYPHVPPLLSPRINREPTGGEVSVYGTGTGAGAAANQGASGWDVEEVPHGCHITILHRQGSMILWRPVRHDVRIWAWLDVLALSSG